MLITNLINVDISSGRIQKHYEDKGYSLPRRYDKRGRLTVRKGTLMTVAVSDLPPSSGLIVKYKCDMCGDEKSIKYEHYVKATHQGICGFCVTTKLQVGKNNSSYIHGEYMQKGK